MEGSPNHQNQQTELQELEEYENKLSNEVNEQPKKKTVTLWTLYFHLCTKKELFLVLIAIISSLLSGISLPISVFFYGELVSKLGDSYTQNPDSLPLNEKIAFYDDFTSSIRRISLNLVYFGIAAFFTYFLMNCLWNYIGLKQIHHLKEKYFALILSQEQKWFESQNMFEYTTKIQTELDTVERGLGEKTSKLIESIGQLIAGIVIPFFTSWKLPAQTFGIDGLTIVQQRVIAIFVFATFMWLTEAVPAWATSLAIITLMLLTTSNHSFSFFRDDAAGNLGTLLKSKDIMATFADPIIILFLGGFILAIAATKSGLDLYLAKSLLRPFGHNSEKVLLGFILITGIFSMFVSNTATAAMMLTFLTPVFKALPANGKGRVALTLSIPVAANIGGASVYGQGYAAGETDESTSVGKSSAPNETGNGTEAPHYKNKSVYDSFFYRWFTLEPGQDKTTINSSGTSSTQRHQLMFRFRLSKLRDKRIYDRKQVFGNFFIGVF